MTVTQRTIVMLAIAACWFFVLGVLMFVFQWGLLIMLPLAFIIERLERRWLEPYHASPQASAAETEEPT